MNIAIISRSTSAHFGSGGMESHLKTLAEGLAKSNNTVTVITTSHPHKDNDAKINKQDVRIDENLVKYIYIGNTTPGLNPLSFWEKPFAWLKLLNRTKAPEGNKDFFEESARVLTDLNSASPFDYIISQSTAAKGLINAMKIGIPIVVIIHGTISAEIKNRYLSNKTLKNWLRFYLVDIPKWIIEKHTSDLKLFERAKYIVAVSQDLRNKFVKDYPYCTHKTSVIYNGVDTTLFKPGAQKYPNFTILYVGRMEREKGVDLIIKAVDKARRSGLKIEVKLIGMGRHIYEFKKLADELHLSDEIQFLGQIKNSDLTDYYQRSHVFVFPTRREEGHPVTLSEAFCSGLPVVATRKGGLSELIVDGESGYYIDDDDFDGLAYVIRKLASKPELLSKMSLEVRKLGESKFSKNAMIREYSKLLTKTLQ